MAERAKILITIKTYPLPSSKYQETVCTAGVREDGSFIRLFPIDYRMKPYDEWYGKYQWIEVDIEKNTNDPRPESYRPVGNIIPLGKPILTEKNGSWNERKKYVLTGTPESMCKLDATPQSLISLGIIKPRIINDFVYEPADREWGDDVLARMGQMNLFEHCRNNLEKIPYKFSYIFKCQDPLCRGHKKMIEDWEVGQLYRKMREKFMDEEVACKKVKERFLTKMCSADRDTHFFVGTVLKHATWVILGVFWPKRI